MKNVEMEMEGNILHIRCDLSKRHGKSASGKTTIISSTEGNIGVPDAEPEFDAVKIGLNIYTKE